MFSIPTAQGLAAKALCVVVAAAALLAVGAYGGYRYEKSAVEALKLADARALAMATLDAADKQHAVDTSGQAAAVTQAYLKGKLDGTIINFKTEAPANVTITQDKEAAAADRGGCVTYGFYRMLAAGERGRAAASLPLPAGATPDACTGEQPSDVAAKASADLADGYGNGQQLDALIAELTRQEAIRAGQEPPVSTLPREAAP